jgi:hypothetical protein
VTLRSKRTADTMSIAPGKLYALEYLDRIWVARMELMTIQAVLSTGLRAENGTNNDHEYFVQGMEIFGYLLR